MRAGHYEAAVQAYDEAITLLGAFDADKAAGWSLVLCLSNRAQARLKLRMHVDALSDCASTGLLLDRYEANFVPEEVSSQRTKLASRERAGEAIAAELRDLAKREATEAAAAQRRAEQLAARQKEQLRQATAKAARSREARRQMDAAAQRRAEQALAREEEAERRSKEEADRQQLAVEAAAERTRCAQER